MFFFGSWWKFSMLASCLYMEACKATGWKACLPSQYTAFQKIIAVGVEYADLEGEHLQDDSVMLERL